MLGLLPNDWRRFAPSAPPAWLFRRSKVKALLDPDVLAQLPPSYRALLRGFDWYLSGSPDRSIVRSGGYAFRLAKAVHRAFAGDGIRRMHVDGYTVDVDLGDARFLSFLAELRDGVARGLVARFVGLGDTVVDVGANQGAYSVIGAHLVGAAGTVVAIEPQAVLAAAIRRSLEASPAEAWQVFNVALGDHEGQVEFFVDDHYSGTAGVHESWSGTGAAHRVVVPLRAFDEAVDWEAFTGAVFVKLDCEGSELATLRGARAMIRARRPVIYMEVNPKAMAAAGTDLDALRDELRASGYDSYEDPDAPGTPIPLADMHTDHHYDVLLGA